MSMDNGPIAESMPSIKIIFVRFAEVSMLGGIFESAKVRPMFGNMGTCFKVEG
jgi:hypothetical protein